MGFFGFFGKTKTSKIANGLVAAAFVYLIFVFVQQFFKANENVNTFCDEVVLGNSIVELEAKAVKTGMRVIKTDMSDSRPAEIVFMDGAAFARWFCVLEHEDGKVTSKRVDFAD